MRYVIGAAAMLGMACAWAPGVLAQAAQPAQRGGAARPVAPAAASAAPQSQAIAFKCPKSGTVFEFATNGMINDFTSLGADPSDPTLCIWRTRSGTFRSYFSRFGTTLAPEGLTPLRQGMAELFAGTKTEFTAVYNTVTTSGGRSDYEATWRRLGPETITVAGKSVATVTFEQTSRGMAGNTSRSVWKYWYDPEVGHWVKVQTVSGGSTGREFRGDPELVKIVTP